jgi:heme exporter protein A
VNAEPAPASSLPAADALHNALHAIDLAHRFAPGRGLARIEFTIRSPGVAAITGPNGSGKSTLLRIVAGLLRPSQGRLQFVRAGREVAPLARRGHVGFTSPELTFYPELTAEENLRFAGDALGLPDAASAAGTALERTGLAGRARDRAGALSSGLQQRLRLAFALLHRPHVLLLDEPGSHLDDDGRRMLEGLITDHAREGLVVIATNDERESGWAAQRIALAAASRPALAGPVR